MAKAKEKKPVSVVVVLSVFAVFCLCMIYVSIYITYQNQNTTIYFDKYNVSIDNTLADAITNQNEVDSKLKKISEDSKYTIENPYYEVNPYGIAPLSAIIIFQTEEEVDVDVYLNDIFLTNVEGTKKHIIAINELYSNAVNNIKLVTSDGKTNTITVNTIGYNDYLYDYNIGTLSDDSNIVFTIGSLNELNYLRGFDYNNNLIFYLDLTNIFGVYFGSEHYYVSYNSKNTNGYDNTNLTLEMDYLGRIYSISTNSQNMNYEANLEFNDHSYIVLDHDIYHSTESNYDFKDLIDNESNDQVNIVDTNEIKTYLLESIVYESDYKLSTMSNYISYSFNNLSKDAKLIIVNKNNVYAYEYDIYGHNIIKVDDISKGSIYLYTDGTYYNLLTTMYN